METGAIEDSKIADTSSNSESSFVTVEDNVSETIVEATSSEPKITDNSEKSIELDFEVLEKEKYEKKSSESSVEVSSFEVLDTSQVTKEKPTEMQDCNSSNFDPDVSDLKEDGKSQDYLSSVSDIKTLEDGETEEIMNDDGSNEFPLKKKNDQKVKKEKLKKRGSSGIEVVENGIPDDASEDLRLKKKNRRRGKNKKTSEVENTEPDRDYTAEIVKIRQEVHDKIVNDILPKLEVIKSACFKVRKGSSTQNSVISRSTSENSINSDTSQNFKVNPSSLMALKQHHLPPSFNELPTKLVALTPLQDIEPSAHRNVQHRTMSESSPTMTAVEKRKVRSSESDVDKSKTSKVSTPIHRYSREDLLSMRRLSTDKYLHKLRSLRILGTEEKVSFVLNVKKARYNKEDATSNKEDANTSKLSEIDQFLLQLVTLKSNEDREKLILSMSAERKLIFYTNEAASKYRMNPKFAMEANKMELNRRLHEITSPKTPSTTSKSTPSKMDFNNPKFVKTVEEFNESVYNVNFLELFQDCLAEEDKEKTVTELIEILVKTNKASIVQGEVRVNSKNMNEAYVSNDKGKRDVCITGLVLRKYALNGDIVRILVKNDIQENDEEVDAEVDNESDETILDESVNSESEMEAADEILDASKIKPKTSEIMKCHGCVLEITKKMHSRQTIGQFTRLKMSKKSHINFTPRDPRVPVISISKKSADELKIEIRSEVIYLVEITNWCLETAYGNIVRTIGKKNDLEAENMAILLQNDLNPQPFSEQILEQLPKTPFEIPAEEFKYREDLRKKCIFSIDPETARDLDDAVSCEVLENGNLEVGVHISDVSYFLKENSELDDLVKEKATTIYLVHNVYHMLPVPLCLLCSLLPGSDKMAYSVIWEINESTAEIVNTRFCRSIINSCGQLSYEHAQNIIENPGKDWTTDPYTKFPEIFNGFSILDVASTITKLQNIAKILRRNRIDNGALRIDQPKLSFQLNQKSGLPLSFFKYEMKDSNRLIEEFMLLANISVAKFIFEKFPEIAILRNHGSPKDSSMRKLIKNLGKSGLSVNIDSSKNVSESMANIVHQAEYPDAANAVINVLASKIMQRAKYFCSNSVTDETEFWHYALSIPIYTHFTSPIRRYADILVHRVLNAALGYEDPPARDPEELQRLSNVCNVQKYNAKLAGDDSSNLYFRMFVEHLKEIHMKAGVLGVFAYNLEVVLIETGHLVKVYYKNLEATKNLAVKVIPSDDDSPPKVSFIFLKEKSRPVKRITINSELLCVLSIHNDKLVINEVLYV